MSDESSVPRPRRAYVATLADVLIAPGEAFADLAERPRLLFVLLLLMALHLGLVAVWLSRADLAEMVRHQLLSQGREAPPAGQIPVGLVRNMAWAGAVAGLPLVLLLVSGALHFAFTFFLAAELRFKATLSVVAHSFLPASLLGGPLALLVMALKGEWSQPPDQVLQASAAALLDAAGPPRALYSLAGSFDLFTVWTVALLSIGFGVATRRSTGSAAGVVVTLWLLLVLGKAALAALF
jgi:hypothetical protein